MNPFPWLSLVLPDFSVSTSTTTSRPTAVASSPMQIVQWWLQLSNPLPILPIPCTVPATHSTASDSAAAQAARHCDSLHVIAVGSSAALQNVTMEYAVRLASLTAARLTILPLAWSAVSGTGMARELLSEPVEADQQIRLRLAQTDYRTLPHGVRLSKSVRKLSDALDDSADSGQFTLLLVSATDLAALDPEQHGLSQLLLTPGVAVLAHAESQHE